MPKPFVRELIAVKELASGDPVVTAAIASINPTAYQVAFLQRLGSSTASVVWLVRSERSVCFPRMLELQAMRKLRIEQSHV